MASLTYKKLRDPALPAEPTVLDPNRCLNCGHSEPHDPDVGCLVEGGTKYIEDEEGNGKRCCSCELFVPVPAPDPAPEAPAE